MSEVWIAWVAGLLEGEGTFVRRGDKKLAISVHMTDRDIIERLQFVTGVGRVRACKKQREHHKPSWRWTVASSKRAKELAMLVYPWLGKRRREKIDNIVGA
jgi:hypothetical protein